MRAQKYPMIIFAVNTEKRPAEELLYVKESMHSGVIDVLPVTGSYKNVQEQSYAAILPMPGQEKGQGFFICQSIVELALAHKQESVLIVDANGQAKLMFMNEELSEIDLGEFKAVPEDVARMQESWTYDPRLNTYFICSKEPQPVVSDIL